MAISETDQYYWAGFILAVKNGRSPSVQSPQRKAAILAQAEDYERLRKQEESRKRIKIPPGWQSLEPSEGEVLAYNPAQKAIVKYSEQDGRWKVVGLA